MLIAVYTVIILLMLLPLLAEIRMVIRAILAGDLGVKASRRMLKELPFLQRLTLCGLAPRLNTLRREYGQYLRMQLLAVVAAALAIFLMVLFVNLRMAVPALLACLVFCVGSFGWISIVHAHAGYDADTRTTRYDRRAK